MTLHPSHSLPSRSLPSSALRALGLAALALTAACAGTVIDESPGSSGSGAADGSGTTTPDNPPEPCKPDTQEACYAGPAATQGVGICHAGLRTCAADGNGFGPCAGEVVPGAEVCGSPADETCDGEAACTGKLQWAIDDIGKSDDHSGADIAADAQGNVLVTGSFDKTFDVGGVTLASDSHDAFVLKLDPAGKGLWARQAHGNAYGSAIASDAAGNVLVAGGFDDTVDLGSGPLKSAGSSDVYVAKYSPDGELLWSRGFGGSGYQWAEAMAVDAAGNSVIIGGIHDGADFGDGYVPAAGNTDFFVMKLDPSGNRLWSKQLGTAGYDYGMGVAVDAKGAVLISGSFDGTLDLGGGALKFAGDEDLFFAKLAPDGAHVFSRSFGGDGHDQGRGIAVGPAGNIVVAGLFSSTVDFGGGPLQAKGAYDAFLAYYYEAGGYLGSQGFGGAAGTAYAVDVAVDGAGNAVIFGQLTGTASFGGAPLSASGSAAGSSVEDVFVAKYDPSGQHVYSHVFGDGQQQLAYGLALDGAGSGLLTGNFQGTIDFGGGPLSAPSPNGRDIYIAKLAP
jgi:hypothetical protein